MEPIQLTLTNGVWFMGTELDPGLPSDALNDRFADFALAVWEKHGVDVFGLGMVTLQ